MNLKFVRRVSERERAIRPFVIVKNKLMSVFNESVRYWQWISSSHCQSSLRIHSAIASWIHSYFDNVMTKFMINNRTDAWKTDVNLLIHLVESAGKNVRLPALHLIGRKNGGIFAVIGQELLVLMAHVLWANRNKANGKTIMEINLQLKYECRQSCKIERILCDFYFTFLIDGNRKRSWCHQKRNNGERNERLRSCSRHGS